VAVWVRIHKKKKKLISFFVLFIYMHDDYLVGFVLILTIFFSGFCLKQVHQTGKDSLFVMFIKWQFVHVRIHKKKKKKLIFFFFFFFLYCLFLCLVIFLVGFVWIFEQKNKFSGFFFFFYTGVSMRYGFIKKKKDFFL
jgi:hypothetical protein